MSGGVKTGSPVEVDEETRDAPSSVRGEVAVLATVGVRGPAPELEYMSVSEYGGGGASSTWTWRLLSVAMFLLFIIRGQREM